MLHATVLYWTLLYCAARCCTYLLFGLILIVLCCTVLYCAVLTHTVVWYVVLFCRKRTWPLVPVNILVVSMHDDPVIRRTLLPRLFRCSLRKSQRFADLGDQVLFLFTYMYVLNLVKLQLMFFMLIILFMDTLNQFIFVCSHVVTEMAISLHYLLTNERLEGFFFFYITMDFYLYISLVIWPQTFKFWSIVQKAHMKHFTDKK